MKFTRKRKLLVMVGIVILTMIATAWWLSANSKPALTFVGFGEVNGERRALFSVQNYSPNQMDYSSALVAPCDGPPGTAPQPTLVLEGCRFDIVNIPLRGGTLQTGESALLSIPMEFGVKKGAFQLMLPIRIGRPKWLESIAQRLDPRLPNSLWKPQELNIWSEVVTP
jgi:hypothetical protein